jgi:hypothetical protein
MVTACILMAQTSWSSCVMSSAVDSNFQQFTIAVKYLFHGPSTLRTLAGTMAAPATEQTQAFQVRLLGDSPSSMPFIIGWLCFAQAEPFASHHPAHVLCLVPDRPPAGMRGDLQAIQWLSSALASTEAYLISLLPCPDLLKPLQLPVVPGPAAVPASFA